MLIEDEEISNKLLKNILVLRGYKVIAAYDGLQGIAAYQKHCDEIDAVISDLGLPKLDGEEVFKQIKAINPEVKIILISGYIDPEIKTNLNREGVHFILQKPYVPEQILAALRNVIGNKIM